MSLNNELLINFEDLPQLSSNTTLWDIENNEKIQFMEYIENSISKKIENILNKRDEQIGENFNSKMQELKKETEKKLSKKNQEIIEKDKVILELKNELYVQSDIIKDLNNKIIDIVSNNNQDHKEIKNQIKKLHNDNGALGERILQCVSDQIEAIGCVSSQLSDEKQKKDKELIEIKKEMKKCKEKSKEFIDLLETVIVDLTMKHQLNAEKYSSILSKYEIEIEYIDYSFVAKELEEQYNRRNSSYQICIIFDKILDIIPVKKMSLKMNELTNLDFSDIIVRDHELGINSNLVHFIKNIKRRREYYQINNNRLIMFLIDNKNENEIKNRFKSVSIEFIPDIKITNRSPGF